MPDREDLDPTCFNHSKHRYTSTACWHYMHNHCRQTCKFCISPCQCECHQIPDDHKQGQMMIFENGQELKDSYRDAFDAGDTEDANIKDMDSIAKVFYLMRYENGMIKASPEDWDLFARIINTKILIKNQNNISDRDFNQAAFKAILRAAKTQEIIFNTPEDGPAREHARGAFVAYSFTISDMLGIPSAMKIRNVIIQLDSLRGREMTDKELKDCIRLALNARRLLSPEQLIGTCANDADTQRAYELLASATIAVNWEGDK